ncbi:stalk domain-containing protein [Paenibacillus daejeonensis]|uniref:stalk domain-containing protein n=1 Tax=Paenibacillus daejeonensis TaxID=135193 RepID=UPI00035F0419|nr:stalk domain-containing protein [Paenibacillus daejeonensis]
MKKKIVSVVAGVTVLVGVFGAGVYASPHLQEIRAYLNSELKIRVNGQIQQLNDSSGHNVLPITYNGTTYLPVRAVSDVLNINVHYDQAAKEVVLGERLEGVALVEERIHQTQLRTTDPAHTTYGGRNYGEVIYSPAGTNVFTTFYEPRGKYQKIYIQVAALDKDIESVEISDHEEKLVLKRHGLITPQDGLVTIEADITGTQTLVVRVNKDRSGGYFIPLTTSYYK